MANPNPGPKQPKHAHQLVQRVRGAILNAMDVLDQRDKPLSQLLADEAEKHPIKFTEMVAKHIPKDIMLTTKSLKAKDMSDAELYAALTDSGKLAEFVALQAKEMRDKLEQDEQKAAIPSQQAL